MKTPGRPRIYSPEEVARRIAEGQAWQDFAGCANSSDVDFVPESEKNEDPQIIAAKQICDMCLVRQLCLKAGLTETSEYKIPFGVWGGQTRKERNAILKKRSAEESKTRIAKHAQDDMELYDETMAMLRQPSPGV